MIYAVKTTDKIPTVNYILDKIKTQNITSYQDLLKLSDIQPYLSDLGLEKKF